MRKDRVTVFGPASLSNMGPGFDALGLCLQGIGDVVKAHRTTEPGIHLDACDGAATVPADPMRNTATRAALAVLQQAGATHGLGMQVHKGIPLGSGIGGSSASAVAGAWAANQLLDRPLPKSALVEAVMDGESIASGARHGDNVIPALLGGLVLLSPTDPSHYRTIALPHAPALAIVLPEIEVLTHTARAILPAQVPFVDAIHNAADLALMVAAFREGDWASVGRLMMQDRLVEPVRAALVPCYDAIRRAALHAGAHGCALTGSGPAMFALASDDDTASAVMQAMVAACTGAGFKAKGLVTSVDFEGVRIVKE